MDKLLKKEDEGILVCGTEFVFDSRLSFGAKGLLVSLLSLKDSAKVNLDDFNDASAEDWQLYKSELIANGYLSEEETYYRVSSSPQFKI